eukprot:scaffold4768_cov412-Prasinococcus_capsulatus_cf.AAC.15
MGPLVQAVTMGLAEAYRTGMIGPAFSELSASDPSPGGRFDPLVSPLAVRNGRERCEIPEENC